MVLYGDVCLGVSLRVALHDGNTQCGYAGTTGFRLKNGSINRLYTYRVCSKGISGSVGIVGIISIVIGVVVSTGSTLVTFFHGNS